MVIKMNKDYFILYKNARVRHNTVYLFWFLPKVQNNITIKLIS